MGLLSTRREGKRLIDDASTGTQQPPRISINDNKFTLVDPGGSQVEVPFLPDGPALDVVFVDRNEHTSKLFWGMGPDGKPKPFNPSEVSPPVCFSDNGVAPSATAADPQSPTCAQCPHNVIGSAISQISQAKIKACQDLKKLAVVVKGYAGAYQFTIKPGSFKNWNNYTNFLRMQKLPDGGGRPDLSDVVTRIRFVGRGIMSFEAIELVTDDSPIAPQVIEVWERNKNGDLTGLMVGRYDEPAQGVLPAPAKQAAEPPPQQGSSIFFQSQMPQAPPADQPKVEEPKRRGRPAAQKPAQPEKAAVQPAPPVAPHGMQPASSAPSDLGSRLDNIFKLPLAK